jgi:hypothetical protein
MHAQLQADDTVQGLRYARNRVHHQWAEALDPRDVPFPRVAQAVGRGSRIITPPTVLAWFWKPIDRLPPPPKERPDKRGQAAYKAHLAGKPARDALDHLDDLLRR